MFLVKQNNGSYVPAYESDYQESAKVKVGDEVRAKRARNVKMHRKFFALLKLGFESQDKFDSFDIYRMVILMKSGHVVFVEGTDKQQHPLPMSISFDKMGQTEFENLYNAVLTVISKEIKLSTPEIETNLMSFY